MKRKKILLIQLPIAKMHLSDTVNIFDTLPLACGYLKAMASKYGYLKYFDITLLDPIIQTLGSEEVILEKIRSEKPDILGVSLYPWNAVRSLYLIDKIKKEKLKIKIIAGGPQVQLENKIVMQNKDIDYFVFDEGEDTFIEFLKYLMNKKKLSRIKGMAHRKDGKIIFNGYRTFIQNLKKIPSPYLLGFLNPEDYEGVMWLETQRGCVFKCKYCVWSGKGNFRKKAFDYERIKKELDFAKKKNVTEFFFLDSNFNLSPHFKQICGYISKINKDKKMIFSATIRAEFVDEEQAKLLSDSNFYVVEVGLQSVDEAVQKNIGRKNMLEKFLNGVKLLWKYNVKTRVGVIVGLPGETKESFKKLIDFLKKNNLNCKENKYGSIVTERSHVMFYGLAVNPGTKIYKEKELFKIKSQNIPPFRVLSTKELSFNDIQNAIKSLKKANAYFETEMYLRYDTMNLCAHYGFFKKGGNAGAKTPISKIILDFTGKKNSNLNKIADKIGSKAAKALIVWIKTNDLAENTEEIKKMISIISLKNPYMIWHVFVETGKEFNLKLLDTIDEKLFFEPNNMDFESVYFQEKYEKQYKRVSFKKNIILLADRKYKKDWLKTVSAKYNYYWIFKNKKIENADIVKIVSDSSDGVIIDDSAGCAKGEIMKYIDFLSHNLNIPNKKVLFTNWLAQRLWEFTVKNNIAKFGVNECAAVIKDDNVYYNNFTRENLQESLNCFCRR